LPDFVCIFEDKKFSNFFPLSLSQPVFELRIGFYNLRQRLQEEFAEAAYGVLCRDYLSAVMLIRDPNLTINEIADGDTIFLNGRLICMSGELEKILEKLPPNGIAVKGGYVVAAKLSAEAASDFARYIRKRIGEDSIAKLCKELKSYVQEKKTSRRKPKEGVILSEKPEEGTYEDDHLLGQDNLQEKLPQELSAIIKKHDMTLLEVQEAKLLSFPWQIIDENKKVLEDDFQRSPFRGQSEETVVYSGVDMVGEENIVVGEAAVLKPGVVLDASSGPIVIGDNTVVMANATIIGPVYIGRDSLIKPGAKILEGTSIGDVCKIGGEVDSTIFAAKSNKQHDGFIGHSYIGEWVNIGAGANNSDLKNNYSPVNMWCAGISKPTGRQFLGLIMGDHCKVGITTSFNTGTVIGFNCNLYGSEMPDKFVPSFSWGQGRDLTIYDIKKALLTAQVVMERREIKWEKAHRTIFEKIFALSQECGRNI
jgi:UDP-N-acetylglucosamine diphosphorylase/glucosamine-1-phosphate N-acetyltransferase